MSDSVNGNESSRQDAIDTSGEPVDGGDKCPNCGADKHIDPYVQGEEWVCGNGYGRTTGMCEYAAGLRSTIRNMEQRDAKVVEITARCHRAERERDEALGGNHYYEVAKELRAVKAERDKAIKLQQRTQATISKVEALATQRLQRQIVAERERDESIERNVALMLESTEANNRAEKAERERDEAIDDQATLEERMTKYKAERDALQQTIDSWGVNGKQAMQDAVREIEAADDCDCHLYELTVCDICRGDRIAHMGAGPWL